MSDCTYDYVNDDNVRMKCMLSEHGDDVPHEVTEGVFAPPTRPLLTPREHQVMKDLGSIAGEVRKVIVASGGLTSQINHDWAEAAMHIHNLQHMIMAQAAARAYPDLYRTLGGSIG